MESRSHFAHVQGESPLHTACRCGLAGLTAELLQQGANPNLQTQKPLPEDAGGVAMQSPLHMAIAHNHPDVVSVILEQKGQLPSLLRTQRAALCTAAPHRFLPGPVAANALHATNNFQIIPDFSLKDSLDQTVLGLALWTGNPLCRRRRTLQECVGSQTRVCCLLGMHTIAAQLLGSGASINDTMTSGQTLLHMAIQRQDSKSALFLLEHQADINMRCGPISTFAWFVFYAPV